MENVLKNQNIEKEIRWELPLGIFEKILQDSMRIEKLSGMVELKKLTEIKQKWLLSNTEENISVRIREETEFDMRGGKIPHIEYTQCVKYRYTNERCIEVEQKIDKDTFGKISRFSKMPFAIKKRWEFITRENPNLDFVADLKEDEQNVVIEVEYDGSKREIIIPFWLKEFGKPL